MLVGDRDLALQGSLNIYSIGSLSVSEKSATRGHISIALLHLETT